MKISTRSRYGLRFMLELALYSGQGPVFLKAIAKKAGISEKYLSQIVIALKSHGLIAGSRGVHGGYVLTRSPAQINLREIVQVLEGDLNIVECVKSKDACARNTVCVTHDIWKKLSEAIVAFLTSFTLADLVQMHQAKLSLPCVYQI